MGLVRGPASRVRKCPRHTEVNQKNQTAFEPDNQILPAPVYRRHALAHEFRSHHCRIDRPS